jgi:hypothetical protein
MIDRLSAADPAEIRACSNASTNRRPAASSWSRAPVTSARPHSCWSWPRATAITGSMPPPTALKQVCPDTGNDSGPARRPEPMTARSSSCWTRFIFFRTGRRLSRRSGVPWPRNRAGLGKNPLIKTLVETEQSAVPGNSVLCTGTQASIPVLVRQRSPR